MLMGGKTQEQNQQTIEAPPRQSFSVLQMIVILVVGITAGAAATWMMLIGSLEGTTPWIDFFLHWVLPILGVAGAALVLLVPLTWWGVRRLIKRAHGTLDQVTRETISATQAASEGNAPAAASHAERAVLEVLAWYGPIAARRWVVQTSLALLVGFGGLIGTAMLFRQTVLLGEQNKKLTEQTDLLRNQNEKLDQQTDLFRDQNTKLDLQTVTAEAQRRAGLSAELFAILQAVSLINVEASGTTPSQRPGGQVPRGLQARIVALSRAATPYRIIEVPENAASGEIPIPRLADRALSPERGQLLVGLVLADIEIPALKGITFERADLRNAGLTGARLVSVPMTGADLANADLTNADLTNASLAGANLTNADLSQANLAGASLYQANLTDADLAGANLAGASPSHANLTDADLAGANLTRVSLDFAMMAGAVLSNANLTGALLTDAVLVKASLTDADLTRANLAYADLTDANLAYANLTGANLTRADLTHADLTDTDLTGANLTGANLTGAVVGRIDRPGKPPRLFPRGWNGPLRGWELYDDQDLVRLRRSEVPSSASSPP